MRTARANDGGTRKRSWRFWMLLGYALIVAVFVIVWLWSLYGPLDREIASRQTESLTSIAKAGAISLGNTDLDADQVTTELSAGTDLRMTLIAADGTVLSDSQNDAATLENHATRPEVTAALAGEIGSDQRKSTTDGDTELYVAVPATYQGRQVVLRVSEALSSIHDIDHSLRTTGLILLFVGVVLAGLIAWRSYRNAAHPVNHLEKVRTDFVANASHELKTPVAGIRLLSDAITTASDEGDLEQTKVFAKRLDSEADRLQHLVTDLLDLSRLEGTDQGDLHLRSDMHSAVTTSFEAHRRAAVTKKLSFELDDMTQPSDGCYVHLDASDASLIIDNLLDNAIAYTESGKVTVRIALEDGCITVAVSDTGIGIPPVDQARIFERFYRVDKARSREVGGTGLGLSLVRHAVKRGGGTIDVSSVSGEGSIFTVRMPLTR